MIKSKDVNAETKILDEKAKAGTATIVDAVKALSVLIKEVRDVRTNMTTIMKFYKIPLIEPDIDSGKVKTDTPKE